MTGVIIDISLLLIIVIFVVVGYFRGFLKTILSLLGTVGSLVISYFVKDFFAGILNNWFGLGDKIANVISKQVSELAPTFSSVTVGTVEELLSLINESEVGLIYKKIFSMLVPDSISASSTVAQVVGSAVGSIAVVIIAFLVVFLLIKLLVFLLNKIVKKIPKRSLFGKANRALGAIGGLINGLIILGVILVVLNFLCMIPSLSSLIYPVIEKTYITKHIYQLLGQILL